MRRLLALVVAVVPLLATGTSFAAESAAVNSPELWKKKCSMCHGEDGKAKTKMGEKYSIPDISSAEWQTAHKDDEIKTVIVSGGKTKMPPWKDKLSGEEIDAMVKHVRTLKK